MTRKSNKQEEIHQQKVNLDSICATPATLESISQSISNIQRELGILPELFKHLKSVKEAQKDMQHAIDTLEKSQLSKSLVIMGLPETANEAIKNTEEKVSQLLEKMNLQNVQLEECRRMGQPNPGVIRPIAIKTLKESDKYEILKEKHNLRAYRMTKDINITPQRTKKENRQYQILQKKAKESKLINPNTTTFIRNSTLTIQDMTTQLQTIYKISDDDQLLIVEKNEIKTNYTNQGRQHSSNIEQERIHYT